MSVSIIILKEIEGFSCAEALSSVRRAADKAGLFCAGLEASWHADPFTGAETECVSGTLCEVCAEEVKARFDRGVETRQCGFTIQGPEDSSCGSFTWLIQKKNYFWALDLDYLGGGFEFAFRFLSQYFRLPENARDYIWIDDTDWFYTAGEFIQLSEGPYDPAWHYRKSNKFSILP